MSVDNWISAIAYSLAIPILMAPALLWVLEPAIDWYAKREERMRRLDGKR